MAFGIDDLIGQGLGIINKFIPDPAQREKAEQSFRDWLSSVDLAQLEVNKEEAKSASLFVAGWRPFVGWVCGMGFALHILIIPVANWILVVFGEPIIDLKFDMSTLMTVMMGMLGMGGLRTYEKMKGVARDDNGGMLSGLLRKRNGKR